MPDMGNIRIKDENMNKTTIITNVQTHLFELQDLKYRDFHAKLMPTVNKEKDHRCPDAGTSCICEEVWKNG